MSRVLTLGDAAAVALASSAGSGSTSSRPPLGVYNVSIGQVTHRLERLLDVLDARLAGVGPTSANPEDGRVWEADLIERTDAFLDSVMEHHDDAKTILNTIGVSKATFNRFQADVRPHRDDVGKVVNKIKHEQGRLRFVQAEKGDDVVMGYYVEAPFDGGTSLGPSELVHPPDGRTAFSYNRDVRFHVAEVVGISEALARAVATITATTGAASSAPLPAPTRLPVLERVAQLERTVFPDEGAKPWPSVIDVGPDGFEIERSSTSEAPTPLLGPFQVYASMRGDGVTRTFRIPYWNRPI